MKNSVDLIVIGGGAAGFFGALQAAEMKPGLKILILEKSSKLLSKVKVSGGGRCNVTQNCFEPGPLSHHYPRGEKQLKQLFKSFHAKDMVNWLASKNVKLKAEQDGRMFPTTDDSQTIIDCFLAEAKKQNIRIETNMPVVKITTEGERFNITCQTGEQYHAGKILIATGGHNNPQAYDWISDIGHIIINPIPSLFTFNDSQKQFSDLMGISVPDAEIKIAGTKYSGQGPILITHWGLSGPAIIKLSAWAAEHLHKINYEFTTLVSWIGPVKEEEVKSKLNEQKKLHGKQNVISHPRFGLPKRLWQRLCEMSQIEESKIWAELPQKNLNKLMEFIIRCPFSIRGKTTFKEEFVICGGVDLNDVNLETMESKRKKNIFFAGEVLHIDGETGGFNFQAAWTTAHCAAKGITNQK
jgi:predicted Rossmann fold flavoprotein